MIFKTFNSDIDKISSKWGMFGRSFNDFIEASNKRKIVIDDLFTINGFPLKDAKKQVGSFWSYLYPKKEDIKSQLIDVDSLIPQINENKASKILETIKSIENGTNEEIKSFQVLYDTGNKTNQWIAEYAQSTKDQIRSTEGVIKANQQARASALAHNEAIKAQTFSAKAGKVALQALATVGNMVAMWAITKGLELAVKGIDELAHSAEHCAERVDELMSNYQFAFDRANSNAKTVEDLAPRYEELSKGVNNLGQNVSLTADEYSEYNDIVNQIADMFPTMVQGYTNEGNAILSLRGNVEQLREAYKEAQQEAYNMLIISGEDSDGNDIIENYHNKVSNDNPFVKPDSTAQEYIDIINSFHEAMLTSDEAYNQLYEEMIKNKQLVNEYDMSAKQFTKIKKVLDDIGFKSELSDEDKQAINNSVKSYTQTYQAEIDNALQGVQSLANAYLMTNEDYAELDDDAKTAASLIVNSIDTELANGFEGKTDVGAYVDNIVSLIKDNPDVSNALNELFNTDFSNLPYDSSRAIIDQYIDTIVESTRRDPVELKATLGFSEYDDNENLMNNVKEKLQDEFDDKAGELTLRDLEIAANLDIPKGVFLSWDELIAEIEEAKRLAAGNTTPLSISNTITQLNTRLKPAMDSLKSTYQDIFSDEGKFDLNSIDILSTCDTIKSKLDEMSELGLIVDYSAYEDFVSVLSDSKSTEQDVERAFDTLSTAITHAAVSGTEDFETLKSALAGLGVENSAMVAFDALTNNMSLFEEKIEQAGLKVQEFVDANDDGSNSASDAAQAFLTEMVGAENCGQALALLQLKQIAINQSTITTADDCQNIFALAQTANVGIAYLEQLNTLMNLITKRDAAHASGDSRAVSELNRAIHDFSANLLNNLQVDDIEVPWENLGKGAGSAGSKAGKDYKDALKEELSDLEGVISGVTGRIDDQISSINEQKSTALDAIDAEKEALEDAKDAAVEALETEREARLEVIDTEKEQLEAQIKLIDKQIDAKQDEIDAINDAADARQRELDLHKAQYELERMQNQRTILQYSEDKGMHYVQDTSGMRDAKESVDDAKRQIEIANLENEKKLLEDQKNLLNEQIDLLDERADAINKYYDEQIKQTEAFYDTQINALEKQRKETESYFESLTENLETQKSKFQELTELLEKAELSAKLKQLGIDEEALLNGSEEEFEKLKTAYLDIVYQLNAGNDNVLEKLRELSGYDGTAPAVLSDSNTELDAMNGKLDESNTNVGNVNTSLGKTASTTSDVATNVSEMSSSLTEATAQVIEEQTAFNNLKLKIDEVIEAINQKTEAIKEEQNATSIATSSEMADFLLLKEKILEVKETLESFGTPEEGLISDIASAIQSLNDIKLDDGLIEQFTNLKAAIDSVTSAISGGGGESSDSEGQSGGAGKGGGTRGKDSKGEGGGGGSLTDALTSMGETVAEVIGEADAEGDGTVIGEFGALKTAVNNVTSAIGSGESEDGKGKGGGEARGKDGNGEDSGNLIGSIVNLGETTEETLGEPGGDGVIGRFEQFKEPIAEAVGHVHSISDGLDEIDGKEVECTITVNVNQKGNAYAGGTVLGSMNLNNAVYTAQYGKAFANGTGKYKGLPEAEKDALLSEYGQTELTVLPNGNTIITDGPTLMDLPKGTVIFNENQTKQLIRNKIHVDDNTHGDNSTSNIPPATSGEVKIIPFQPSDQMYDYIQKWNAYFGDTDNQIGKLIPNSIYERSQQMHNIANQITNGNITNKNQPNVHVGDIHITCPGVTSKEVAKQVGVELNHMFTGLHLDADQQSRMR